MIQKRNENDSSEMMFFLTFHELEQNSESKLLHETGTGSLFFSSFSNIFFFSPSASWLLKVRSGARKMNRSVIDFFSFRQIITFIYL
jgi:hypothetical protein